MLLRTVLTLPLACLPLLASAQGNWQAPAISAAPPNAAAPGTAPAKPTLAPAPAAAAAPAAPKKPASGSELASKIVERLEQAKTELPAPKARAQMRNNAQSSGSASSFLTPAELRAKLAAQAAASKAAQPVVAASQAAPKPRAQPAPKAQPVTYKPPVHRNGSHWSYTGSEGPEHWGALSTDFARCATGKRQSPIDIRDGIRLDLEVPVFEYQSSRFAVIDNGHTIQVNLLSPNYLHLTGRRYELVQFHFHHPSEEKVDGRGYDMVVHLVHKDPDGRLAVVAVLIERGMPPHESVQMVWNNLPLEKNETVSPASLLDLVQLLPTRREYYTYMGSLTTPPCSEGVLWLVMKQPIRLSDAQIRIFARLYPMNARPVQLAGDRLIKESN